MNTKIKATGFELTSATEEHINKCVEVIGKFVNSEEGIVSVEVGRTTNHHKQGDVFRAEFDVKANGKKFFAMSESDDLMHAIEEAKDAIIKSITHNKDRKQTLFKRGAKSVKKMMKGLSDRNPFTSKY